MPATTRPSSLTIACADGGEVVSNIRWSSWTATQAVGRGTYHQLICTPSCAQGHEVTTTIPIVLSNPVKTATGYKFSTMTLNAGGDDPETDNILN